MKLPCKVIEDMLPMYYDGICSEESSVLIDEHLQECPRCSGILIQLQSGIEASREQMDDLKPLEEIQKQWKKSKRSSRKNGIWVTLAALLVTISVWAGIWYFGYAKYYTRLGNKMDKITGAEATMTTADYKKETEEYQYLLKVPLFLSDDAFVRVTSNTGIVMFFYPEFGGEYSFSIMVSDENGTYRQVWLNPDLTPNYEKYTTPVSADEEKVLIQQLLDEKQNEIIEMFDAVYKLWGIEYLTAGP